MGFDPMVANAGRLAILAVLAQEEAGVEFVRVRRLTGLTDGNLSAHARRLAGAGLIEITKAFREGKPVTTLGLTGKGREALERHAREVLEAVGGGAGRGERREEVGVGVAEGGGEAEEWVD